MIRKTLCTTFCLALLAITCLAQQKPDFSGTWKLNVAKSDFGNFPAPTSRTDVVVHKEPSLTDSVSAETTQGKIEYVANYSTDGKETTNKVRDRDTKSTAKWDGNSLQIHSVFNINDTEVTANATWTLSGDGKTLNINAHFSSSMGDVEQKLLFEKQDSAAPAPPVKKT
jgi:hypothetical protein